MDSTDLEQQQQWITSRYANGMLSERAYKAQLAALWAAYCRWAKIRQAIQKLATEGNVEAQAIVDEWIVLGVLTATHQRPSPEPDPA